MAAFFARLLILKWLDEKGNTFGEQRLRGYAQVGKLRSQMSRFGIEQHVFVRELETLARGFCIFSEDFRVSELSDEDLVSLAPAGRVHLQICSDVYYLAAIAEDTWFDSQASAEAIANRIKDSFQHYQPRTVLYNARAGLDELTKQSSKEAYAYNAVFEDGKFEKLADLTNSTVAVRQFEKSLVSGPWSTAYNRYLPGTTHSGKITNRTKFGVFVDVELGVTGLVHSSKISGDLFKRPDLSEGETVSVQVLDIDHVARRMSLTLVEPK